ncbi:type II secretion system protein [Pseudoalteromonas sp. SSDWG2]|uniref:type II secretion system protein n=1 Tax=Pseudoalteromonas sp. SSDWG2 TaxID=3139391 RepID=UPI003BAA1440
MRKSSSGFTLIELIVVIVLLGVLAVTVAPKALNLKTDARIAALQSAEAAFKTLDTLVYAKALIQNQTGVDSGVFNIDTDDDGSNDVIGYYGHIKFVGSVRNLLELDDSLAISKSSGPTFSTAYYLIYYVDTLPTANQRCMIEVFYPDASALSAPITTNLVVDDC